MSADELRSTARRFLRARTGVQELRALEAGPGHDRATWGAMVELGWPGLGVRPELGGSGGTLADVAIVAGELGRAAWPGPLLATWQALEVLAAAGQDEIVAAVLRRGDPLALVAPTEPGTGVALADGLRGPATVVEWATEETSLVVVADDPADDVTTLVVVLAPGTPGVSVRPARSLDNERVGLVAFDGVPTAGAPTTAVDRVAVEAALDRGRLLRAAVMVGGAEAVLGLTTEHVLTRHQFGRPLAAFQAVRHLAADVAIAVDGARLLVEDAARTEHPGLVAAAVHVAGRAYVQAVVSAAQLHGGVGVTDEHVLPQHFRRAEAMRLRCGSERSQLEAVADGLVRGGVPGVLGPRPA